MTSNDIFIATDDIDKEFAEWKEECAILAFVELNRQVARGTIRDHFSEWDDVDGILAKLESDGLIRRTTRPTAQGQHDFYTKGIKHD